MTNEYGFEIPLVSEEECKLQERIEELKKENAELKEQIEKMKCCKNCLHNGECDLSGYEECKNFDKWEIKEND